MRRRTSKALPDTALVIATLLLVAVAGCDRVRKQPDPAAAVADPAAITTITGSIPSMCFDCHGDRANGNPAPPRSVRGATATSDVAVGAHQTHLRGSALRAGFACTECHVVPAPGDPFGHIGGTGATLTWGPLAQARGVAASAAIADGATGLTCTNYCHGPSANAGGGNHAPSWTVVDGTQASCGSCHGIPPPSPHPAVTGGVAACAGCHGATVLTDGTIDVAGGKHVNGVIDLSAQGCTSCHGDGTRTAVPGADANVVAAPPLGTKGETLPTSRAVGAHQAHVNKGAGAITNPIHCTECHVVPANLNGHPSGRVDVSFGALAATGGTVPVWTGASCASTYCHGAFNGGAGSTAAPAWTAPGALGCTSCHGSPPPATSGHPQNSSCGSCHPGYTATTVNVSTHVNGRVDLVAMTCTTCHGTPGRTGTDPNIAAAPPVGTNGETATTARAVGAHLRHLQGGNVRGAMACTDCHVVPTTNTHADGVAAVTFGTLAKAGSTTPVWSGTTCASTYCHGATLNAGGSLVTPTWTIVDGTQAACGTCHAIPPPTSTGHPAVTGGLTACAGCHGATVKADGTIDVAGGKHINGSVEVSGGSCTSCHGDATRTPAVAAPAPPLGTHGETLTTARAVGAHQSHLVDGTIRSAIACTECHLVPASLSGHPTGTVNVTFGTLAATGATTPVWNGSTCAATYCHGATLGAGGTANAPLWTTVDGSQRQCTSCHGAPPPTTSGHPAVASALTGCAACHPATVKADGTIDVAGGKHINGSLEVSGASCTSCHGDPTRTPAAIAAAPPKDTQGNTTSAAVGAHLAHLTDGSLRIAMACSDCHAVPSDTAHATLPLDLTWSALARTGAVTPSWNGTSLTCTNYCHGITLFGGTNTSPVWNGGTAQAACGTCHGLPPTRAVGASQHPPVAGGVTACSTCHPLTVSNTGSILTANATHVDGAVQLDFTNMTCTTCHGDATRVLVAGADANTRAAPPVGTHGETLTTTRAVGAHQAHLDKSGGISTPIACAECHTVPATMNHANGSVTVTFGALAKTGSVAPAWNGTTCSSTYCHGNFTGGAGTTPAAATWTGAAMTCTSCHATWPATGRHSLHQSAGRTCVNCHGTGYSPTTVRAASHVNGVKDVGGAGSNITTWTKPTCTPTCHGTQTW